MSDFGKRLRLNRLFRSSQVRTLVVAFDHAVVLGPIPGTLNPREQIQQFARAGVNGVLTNFGMLKFADGLLCEPSPSLILRLDWTSAWAALNSGGKLKSKLLARPEQALRNGADAVLTYIFLGTTDLEFEAKEIARNAQVARECEQVGLPLIIETLARGPGVANPTAPDWIKLHTRVAAELGADVVKTEYTGSARTMCDVVSTCPIPILVLGGERRSDQAASDLIRGVRESGAAGVFFGRNVFQSPDIVGFLKKARALLDGEAEEVLTEEKVRD